MNMPANISRRDYFAAMALQGLLTTTAHPTAAGDLTSHESASIAEDARAGGWNHRVPGATEITWLDLLCDEAFQFADKMIEVSDSEDPDGNMNPLQPIGKLRQTYTG